MSDDIPIGPIIGTAIGLGLLAGAVKITRDILKDKREEDNKIKYREPIEQIDIVQRGLNKMLGR